MLYPVVESIEACGHALFSHTVVLAERISQQTGRPLIYWGHHHLERETGHAVETGADELFENLDLTPARREKAIRNVIRVFELIEEQNSDMLRLARETISQGGFTTRTRLHTMPQRAVRFANNEPDEEEHYDFHFWPQRPHISQQPVVEALALQLKPTEVFLTSELFNGRDIPDVVHKLRLMLLFLSFDITGAPTAYRYLMPISNPNTAAERAVNRLTQRFGRRSHMLYTDWQSLMLDEALAWPVSRMMEFLYLDQETEVFRDLRNAVVHHVDRSPSPLHVYWVMVTIKSVTNAYIRPMSRLARQAEGELGMSLPYLMQRRNPVPSVLEPDPEADAIEFETLRVDEATCTALCAAVNNIGSALSTTFRAMEQILASGAYPELRRLLPSREVA